MVKDFIVSFTDNFKEKTKNPFLGTYLLVWIIRNWELIYTLFNFDKDYNLSKKKEFIFNYYKENDFINNLLTNIIYSLILLILTYLLLNISRFIVNIFEKKLTPWIYKITDSKSIVLKETYDKLKNENSILEQNIDKEKENKVRLQVEISRLEKKIEDLNVAINSSDNENSSKNKLDDEIDLMYNKLKSKKLIEHFISSANKINKSKDGWVENKEIDKSFEYFITLGLVDNSLDNGNYSNLSVSELGKSVLRRVRLEL